MFKLAHDNLTRFAPLHEHLDVSEVLDLIQEWLKRLESGAASALVLSGENAPRIAPGKTAFQN